MSPRAFEVLAVENLVIDGAAVLASRELMSPYVWRHEDALGMLLRAVPPEERPSGRIWFGVSDDGLRFRMDDAPVIAPSLAHLDSGGCEDPTVIVSGGELVVFYTGVDDKGAGQLLWTRGGHPRAFEKRGVAYHCSRTERNTKEATVLRREDGSWCLFHEYAQGGRSRIGFAEGPAADGPWTERDDPIVARPEAWDDYHLSTGPVIERGGELLMFYNGGTKDAHWAIGWAVFDLATMRLVGRCDTPLIAPAPGGPGDRRIAFANSVIDDGDTIALYFSHDDRVPRRATLRPG